jgi:vacuolar-type H+-ATPase subunit E/Vma4
MEKLDVILDRIEKDTSKECKNIIREAEEKSQKIEQEIIKELSETKARLMKKYKKLAESEKLRLISDAKNGLIKEKSIQKNQMIEEAIVKGLELAKKGLDEKKIKKWIEAGLKEIGERECTITIPMRFRKLKLPHKKILKKETNDVTIESKNGTVRIVESLEKKLNENKNLILVEVSKIMFS